jgi:hypothetical protein
MAGLTNLARIATLTFLGALALIVVYQAVTGKFRLGGLLWDIVPGRERSRRLSGIRAQLLVITGLAAAAFLATASVSQSGPSVLSAGLPVMVGLSNAGYLWSQYRRATRPS